jgi:hypothetical protein
MEPVALLDQLVDLARAAGLEVREIRAPAAGEGEANPGSGICRVRGRVWVLLAPSDSEEQRIGWIARALATHARPFLESRYLTPAVRARLGSEIDRA